MLEIYRPLVESTAVSFELTPPAWMSSRCESVKRRGLQLAARRTRSCLHRLRVRIVLRERPGVSLVG